MQPHHQLANELYRERLARAEQQRPARQHLAFRKASKQADRAQRNKRRRAFRKVARLRAEAKP